MAVAYSRYKFITVSLLIRLLYVTAVSYLKPPCDGFRSETATWIQEWPKKSLGLLEGSRYMNNSFQGGDDGRVYRNMCKIPQGSHLKQG
jgi:hypothetical protein